MKKRLGILELLGIAVGNIGMPYNDFCAITPEEFGYIYNAYNEQQQEQYKDNWERMRMLAYIGIQPYAKKGLTPQWASTLSVGKEKARAYESSSGSI